MCLRVGRRHPLPSLQQARYLVITPSLQQALLIQPLLLVRVRFKVGLGLWLW